MKLIKPSIDRLALDTVDVASLKSEARLEQTMLTGDAIGLLAANLSIDESVFERAVLIEAKLHKVSLSDVELKACDLSAAQCSDASYIRIHFTGGRMTGTDLSRSVLQDVIFEDCKLDMANFRFAKLKRVKFIDCALVETDFQVAELTEVEFENCHLEKTEFAQAKIKQVDARSSQLYDIRGWQSLRGLTIDSTQLVMVAPELAAEIGIVVV